MPSRTLIIGCGYVGLPLALRLREEGHEVTGWVHSPASAVALAGPPFRALIAGSVADESVWEGVAEKFDFVIHCASSGRGGADAYEEVFAKGVLRMNARQPRACRIFVSSTSVYGQTQGEWVREESPAEPVTETGRILREAEKAALDAGAVVMRSSGIYGPGRGVLLAKYRRDEAVIEGDGARWINQIHQRDLVAALAHALTSCAPGQVYNVTDNAPVSLRDFYVWCSGFLGKPLPPAGLVNPDRKRGLTSKRISNEKLRATGWQPLYPSFREGIEADSRCG